MNNQSQLLAQLENVKDQENEKEDSERESEKGEQRKLHLWEIKDDTEFDCDPWKYDSWDDMIKEKPWKSNILYGNDVVDFSWQHIGYGWNEEIYNNGNDEPNLQQDILQLFWLTYHSLEVFVIEMPIKVEEEDKVIKFLNKHGSTRLCINRMNEKDLLIKEKDLLLKECELKIAKYEHIIEELNARPGFKTYFEAKEHFENIC